MTSRPHLWSSQICLCPQCCESHREIQNVSPLQSLYIGTGLVGDGALGHHILVSRPWPFAQGSTRAGTQACAATNDFLHGRRGTELRSSWLCGRHSTHQATLPPPCGFIKIFFDIVVARKQPQSFWTDRYDSVPFE